MLSEYRWQNCWQNPKLTPGEGAALALLVAVASTLADRINIDVDNAECSGVRWANMAYI
jgi:hypothetical protein